MVGQRKTDFIGKEIDYAKMKRKENIKKNQNIPIIKKIRFNQRYSFIINFILFEFIFILLPKRIWSDEHYIEITVNKAGYNQILSDEYEGISPSEVQVNDVNTFIINKKVYVESVFDTIYLKFDRTISDFFYMFNNLDTISSVHMHYMFGKDNNMSYMFNNCHNLQTFTYETFRSISYTIIDMKGMFFNCHSLQSFKFHDLFMDCYKTVTTSSIDENGKRTYYTQYYYHSIDFSYMFYNCYNLKEVDSDENAYKNIISVEKMFFNCSSLISVNLGIKSGPSIDLSYMFYNCSKLTHFNNSQYIYTYNMEFMFYNCYSLKRIGFYYLGGYYTYINMSYLFYNCYNLVSIQDINYVSITDARKMFYNCSSLEYIDFNPRYIKSNTSMEKMFYNCTKLNEITLSIYKQSSSSYYIYPSNLSSAFYNCISLVSLKFYYFNTSFVSDFSYMLYNCKNLKYFSFVNSYLRNNLTTNMKGMFQNCESLVSLDLSLFYTSKVEIMWDMFKNCKSLEYLDISDFDTSRVTDMESMFEGCSSLISLNINNFKTPNVRYMNKMFRGCIRLESLYFNNINSTSLGTMQQMFYNCRSLKYLNIYSLTENLQTISELFDEASTDFTLCVKDEENIPNIFEEIYRMSGTTRDCSENCYGIGQERPNITEKKICCPMYVYNNTCVNKCPKRMRASNEDKFCKTFYCINPNVFNYEQDECIENVPDGYYMNDSTYRTIDHCYKTCKTCSGGFIGNKAYCIRCNENYPFYYFRNCLKKCDNGYYNISGFLECECITEECSDCTEDSLENGLCKSCNKDYYEKSDEPPHQNNYIKCYKDPPKYYFNNRTRKYYPCYSSCQECYGSGNNSLHNCLVCDSNNTFAIIKNISGRISLNCYENCPYYYYFDSSNIYHCTETDECPQDYSYLVVELGQCVSSCDDTEGYYKILKNECYKECPAGISVPRGNDTNECKPQCSYEYPFELVEKEKCVASCSIMERSTKYCVTSYYGNRTNMEIQEIIHEDVKRDLLDHFDYRVITENETVIIEENQTIYEILTTRNKNPNSNTTIINLGECEDRLKEYYSIEQDEYLYMLIMDAYLEGKTGPMPIYEVYYPLFNSPTLFQLDLSICEGLKISMQYNIELEDPDLYDKNNPIYNDMCCPYSSKDGVDMVLSDVQRIYIDGNRSICEADCDYEYVDNKVHCNCDIKDSLPPISEIKIDKDKLYKFANIKNIANFGVLKCINLLIVKDRMIYNIGIYAFIPTLIAYIVFLVLFVKFDFKIIKEKIKELLWAILNLKYVKTKKIKKEHKEEKLIEKKETEETEEKPKKPKKLKIPKEPKEKINVKHYNIVEPAFAALARIKNFEIPNVVMKEIKDMNFKKANKIKKNSLMHLKHSFNSEQKRTDDFIKSEANLNINNDVVIIKKKSKNAPPKRTDENNNQNNNENNNQNNNENNNEKIEEKNPKEKKDEKNNDELDLSSIKENKKLTEQEMQKVKDILAYNDKELNDLDFKLAIKHDNRNIFKMYFSFLKTDHSLIKILNSNDYNSRFIKIFLCFYSFSLSYTVNALFFDDDTIHHILEDEGKFNFLYQLPQIIYSSIISYLLGMLLDFLALSEDNIIELKVERVPKKAFQKSKDLLRILKYKFAFFYILSLLFLLFFWYYAICFCAVYKNTQYHLIKDSIIGFGTDMLTPLGTKIAPLIFRVISLKKKSKFSYFISKIIQMFL